MKNLILISLFLNLFAHTVAQTPAPDQNKRILLYGGIAHIGNGEVIENSLIILEKLLKIMMKKEYILQILKKLYNGIIFYKIVA